LLPATSFVLEELTDPAEMVNFDALMTIKGRLPCGPLKITVVAAPAVEHKTEESIVTEAKLSMVFKPWSAVVTVATSAL
jgi:hypothetical protein